MKCSNAFAVIALLVTSSSLTVACGDESSTASTSTETSSGGASTGGASTGGGTTVSDGGASEGGASQGGSGQGGEVPVDKAKDCAATFGDTLTNSFGRVDATVLAVVRPSDTQCPMPNDDHVILQVTMNGAAYRMVINVLSNGADPDVRFATFNHALVGQPWQEGWHTNAELDYPLDLELHADQAPFMPAKMSDLVEQVTDAITLGEKVSIYSSSSGGASTHLIHRNGQGHDGAIVLRPDSADPKWLAFHFADQTF